MGGGEVDDLRVLEDVDAEPEPCDALFAHAASPAAQHGSWPVGVPAASACVGDRLWALWKDADAAGVRAPHGVLVVSGACRTMRERGDR